MIAGVRFQSAAESLAAEAALFGMGTGSLAPIQLDVTSEESIRSAVAKAGELAGPVGLRALINNAGIVVPGPVEHVSAADWRRQFDVNFFGMVEMTKAALPLLRQGMAAHGRGMARLLLASVFDGMLAKEFGMRK